MEESDSRSDVKKRSAKYRFLATVLYAGHVFRAVFDVFSDGMIEMLDDTPIKADPVDSGLLWTGILSRAFYEKHENKPANAQDEDELKAQGENHAQ